MQVMKKTLPRYVMEMELEEAKWLLDFLECSRAAELESDERIRVEFYMKLRDSLGD